VVIPMYDITYTFRVVRFLPVDGIDRLSVQVTAIPLISLPKVRGSPSAGISLYTVPRAEEVG
jgi:hypothetical protein